MFTHNDDATIGITDTTFTNKGDFRTEIGCGVPVDHLFPVRRHSKGP